MFAFHPTPNGCYVAVCVYVCVCVCVCVWDVVVVIRFVWKGNFSRMFYWSFIVLRNFFNFFFLLLL